MAIINISSIITMFHRTAVEVDQVVALGVEVCVEMVLLIVVKSVMKARTMSLQVQRMPVGVRISAD